MQKIIDGRKISQKLKEQLKSQISPDQQITLATILVGDDPASHVYVKTKIKACEEVGIQSHALELASNISQEELLYHIEQCNNNSKIHGILVQLPLPNHINTEIILESINPQKDVDSFHPINSGRLSSGVSNFAPATPKGIEMMIKEMGLDLEGKKVLVIGASNIVGKPMAQLMLNHNATVTIAHKYTKNLKELCLGAEIIICAVGKPNLITADMVSEGVYLFDVGMNRIADASKTSGTRLVGDVDFENVLPKAGGITPVPGGVGPMTITALLFNCLELYKKNTL